MCEIMAGLFWLFASFFRLGALFWNRMIRMISEKQSITIPGCWQELRQLPVDVITETT